MIQFGSNFGVKSVRKIQMSENHLCISGKSECVCQKANEKLKQFLNDEMAEIERYKWCLGVQLCHDPLEDKSINDICFEWITQYAKEFREAWENRYGKIVEE